MIISICIRSNAVNTEITEVATPRKQILGARSRLLSSGTKRPPPNTLQMLDGASDAPVYMSAIVAATIAERI